MLNLALLVRFLLELSLVAVAAWFASAFGPSSFSILSGALGVLVFALVWGLFLSPKRHIELGRPARLLLEAALFAAGGWLLFSVGHRLLAGALVLVELVDKATIEWLEQRQRRHQP